jgi:hypothetical protein
MAVTALGPGSVPELYLAVSLATKPGVQTSNATTDCVKTPFLERSGFASY